MPRDVLGLPFSKRPLSAAGCSVSLSFVSAPVCLFTLGYPVCGAILRGIQNLAKKLLFGDNRDRHSGGRPLVDES